jgi:hypothetical protein
MQEHEFVAAVAGSTGISHDEAERAVRLDYVDLLDTEPVHHH